MQKWIGSQNTRGRSVAVPLSWSSKSCQDRVSSPFLQESIGFLWMRRVRSTYLGIWCSSPSMLGVVPDKYQRLSTSENPLTAFRFCQEHFFRDHLQMPFMCCATKLMPEQSYTAAILHQSSISLHHSCNHIWMYKFQIHPLHGSEGASILFFFLKKN